ncbi:uncharacterized protein LOC126777788 isoform X2 [Nymphalis io]|uniref:uncharacterized protein LOC126777788 isoform X2 n=1 Tax=Inachis io TaxID=171585 RepID=UPI002169293A|nr:uncharacterized protein LOC126777788 isoform X2 [Nymphalis io]
MTSTNDGKDVKSNQTSGQNGKTYYIELYKSLEARLSAECTGEQRTRLVCEAWRRVHSLCQHSAPTTHPHLLAWLQRHTSHTILQTEWQSPKSKDQHVWLEEALDAFIGECHAAISTRDGASPSWESQLLHRAQWFRKVLSNPWGHPVLKALLDSKGIQPTDEEVLGWLKEERGVMFVTRLRQLAASKCDDLALLLAAAVMLRARNSTGVVSDVDQVADQKDRTEAARSEPTFVDILRKEAGFTVDVWELLTDIEFVLLHKGESRSRCIELAKQTPLRNGYQLVERLHSRLEMSPRDKKMWKNAKEVATLIAQVVIARCMVVPTCSGAARVALYGCARSLARLLPADKLPPAAAALAAPAATSRHLHTLATAIHAQCKDERKSFVCELYVRAITAGMNELERLKLKTEKEAEARLTEETLSTWFTQLGSLLSASSRLSCECVLTAFSVHPSSFMYERVKSAPPLAPVLKDIQEPRPDTNSEFGSWATDSRTQTNLVKTSETINLKQTQKQANVLSTAIFAEGEALGLGAELCQDLAVLISGPRVKTLSWDMDRESLLDNCRTYMERTHGGTRALTTELKYLNLDPRSFQHLPEEIDDENDAFYGIEKGYEHLVELQEPEEIWQDAISDDPTQTDSDHSIEELSKAINRRKKKSKRLKYSTDDETDPLSLASDMNTTAKERPYSKERSKEKKERIDKIKIKEESSKDIDHRTELAHIVSQKTKDIRKKEKKKERKERKKKEKTGLLEFDTKQQKPPSGSLSRLVGMKVARVPEVNGQSKSDLDNHINNNLCVTDSDYDSQGKSSITSINSEGNDPYVLFDGLFSMDEIKSPEKSITKTDMLKTDELRVSNCVNTLGVRKMCQAPNQQQQLNFQSVKPSIKSDSTFAVQSTAKNDVREEVKKSIKKLIEFRRHKSINEGSTKLQVPNLHPTLMPDLPTSDNVIGSNSPKVYLNRDEVEQINALKDEVNIILKNCSNKGNLVQESTFVNEVNKKNDKVYINTCDKTHEKVINRDSAQACSTLIKSYQQPLNKTNSNPSDLQLEKTAKINLIKSIETPSQIQYREFLKQRSCGVIKTNPLVKNASDTSRQKQFANLANKQYPKQICKPRQKLSNTNVSIIESVQQDFPKQSTSDASKTLHINTDIETNPVESSMSCQSMANANISPTQNQFQSFLKELQETINAGASKEKPDAKLLPDKTNSPKQKKVDKAPNTFSRLSYLHKNKQNDNKHKMVHDHTKLLKNKTSEDKQDFGMNLDKVNHLQSRGEIVVSRAKANSKSNDNSKLVVQKVQNFKCLPSTKNTPLCLNRQHPIISNMLKSEIRYGSKILNEAENKSFEQKNNMTQVASLKGHLTENDQNDLISLLRQQSKMHPLKLQHKSDEVQKNLINCTDTTHVNKQPSVKSNNKDLQPKDTQNMNINVPILEKSNSTSNLSSSIKVSNNKSLNSVSELKKIRNVKGSGKGSISKNTPKNTDNQTSDWESVMNALLAHKTPSRGPNALDIVLKKDSFEKRSLQNAESHNNKAACSSNNSLRTVSDYSNSKQCPVKSKLTLASSGKPVQLEMTHSPFSKQKQAKKINCQSNDNKLDLKRNSPLVFKEKHLPDVIQNANDPFISGIPNSDYDLLEELMDDDLRKEIGELMSDEEAYSALTQSPKTRNVLNTKTANSFVNKYPNHKVDTASIRKSERVESSQNLDLVINKNVFFQSKPTKDLPPKCNNQIKPMSQTKLNTGTITNDNSNKKPRIISNELITSTMVKQPPNSKMCNNVHSVNAIFTTEKINLKTSNVGNQNKGNNLPATSICNKSKVEEVAITDVQKNNTDNVLNSQNQALDPTRVILTVPQKSATPNVMVIGSDLIYNPYSTVQVEQLNKNYTNLNRNDYVTVNKAPNVSLFTTQFVAPCVNPVIIDHSISLPVIRRVSPNMVMNFNSNISLNSFCPESNNYTIKPHQEFYLNAEEPKSNCNNKIENNIKTAKTCQEILEDNRSPIIVQDIQGRLICNISTSKTELSNNNFIANTPKNIHVEKNEINELQQPLQYNTTLAINHDVIETIKPYKVTQKVEMKITSETLENKSLMSLDTECGIKNPITSQTMGDKKCEKEEATDRERVQLKRTVILNRQLYHRCYDKPIALSYESITPSKEVIQLNENLHTKNYDKTDFNEKQNITVPIEDENQDENSCQKLSVNDSNNVLVSPNRRILLRSSNVIKDATILSPTEVRIEDKKPRRKLKCQALIKKRSALIKPAINKTTKFISNEKEIKSTANTNEGNIANKNENISDQSNCTCVDIEEQITSAIIPNMHNRQTPNLKHTEKNSETIQNYSLSQNTTEKYPPSFGWNDIHDRPKKDDNVSNLKEHAQNTSKSVNPLENEEVKTCDANTPNVNDNIINISDLKTKLCSGISGENSEILSSVIEENDTIVKDNSEKIDNICSDVNLDVQKPMTSENCTGIQSEALDKEQSTTIYENVLEYKDKVIFEELPSCNDDPLKKCVRIKLPNGNTFKATISGKLSVNVDSIFEDPKIKALLWQNINNNSKCTLNIKQVAIKTPHKPHIITTKVHDISYIKKPIDNTETINLISDDEDTTQTFKTEFGNFDIAIMDTDMFNKHQRRLSQKCVVEIERLPFLTKAINESTNELESKVTEAIDGLTENVKSCTSSTTCLKEKISNLIELDDSSNESKANNVLNTDKDINENVDDLKKSLLQDFCVEDKEKKIKDGCEKELSIAKSLKRLTTDSENEEIKSKECLLKIEKCDELIEKMKIQKKMCFVSLVRCDDTLKYLAKKIDLCTNKNLGEKSELSQYSVDENTISLEEQSKKDSILKRSESLSILSDFSVSNESKIQESQLVENKNLLVTPTSYGQSLRIRKCDAYWCMTKNDLHYCYNSKNSKTKNENDKKYDDVSTDCDSDIETSISLNIPFVKETNNYSSNNKKYEVPTLVQLTVNYFVTNSNMIDNLQPYVCLANFGDKPANSSPLKRKSTGIADKVNRHKVCKIENISPNLIFDETDKKVLPKTSNNTQDILLCNQNLENIENIKDFATCNFVKSKESQQMNYCEFESIKKINEDNIMADSKTIIKNEDSIKIKKVVSGREEIKTAHKNISRKNYEELQNKKNLDTKNLKSIVNEINVNTFFKDEQSEMRESETNIPASILINDSFDNKEKNSETRNEYLNTDFFNCDDKIEVIIPLEEIDDENMQSLLLNTTDSRDSCLYSDKLVEETEKNLHQFEVKDKQEVLNINHNMNDEVGNNKEPQPKCTDKYDSKSLFSNEALDENINKNDIMNLGHIENLKKHCRQDYLQNQNNESTTEECENIELQNKNVNITEEVKSIMDSYHMAHNKVSSVSYSNPSDLDTKSSNDNTLQPNVTLVYKGDSSVVLKGSIYEDPVVGTCYVFPILNRASYSDEMDYNNICDEKTINVIQALKNKVFEDKNIESDEKENSNNFTVVIPKVTYSKQRLKEAEVTLSKKNLKRKSDTCDVKLNEKRYRKSKNIDYPKITVTAMAESAYSKEFKRLLNYCSSIKFSFSQPFHKEYIDVSSVLECWPIKGTAINTFDKTDYDNVIFSEENTDNKEPYDPLQQTLAEEISSKHMEHQSSCDQISENNFSMGFGEGSGRVKKISEDGDNKSKFSAATLSDVKQSQPLLLSEDYEDYSKCKVVCKSNIGQSEYVKRYYSYLQIRDKVRAFFKKTTLELNYDDHNDNLKNKKSASYENRFPYDLISPDFIEPALIKTVVQVVQVGQLPVSAAAQNPITCDPRVTQVTDASPSQCSAENGSHDDSQPTIKTEYTELTTADLSLPLVQEYDRHIKSQESSKMLVCNENIPVQMEISEVKIEEMPIKDEPLDYNDNDDLNSLVNRHMNNVDYSYNSNDNTSSSEDRSNMIFESLQKQNSEFIAEQKQQNGSTEKSDQIAHAMNAAGITTTPEFTTDLVDIPNPPISPKIEAPSPVPESPHYSNSPINTMALQQALAQILPPPLSQTNTEDNIQAAPNSSPASQVLHLVQGKNTNGNQMTLVDNTQNSVINNSNTSVLHIVQNKEVNTNSTSNANNVQHSTSYGGMPLADSGLQQGNNQLLHIVNTGNQKNPGTGQLLKRVNLLTNVTNMQGCNEQKMVQFLCKAADGKSIHLNNPHQRSMVLRLQPIDSSSIQVNNNKSECQDSSPSTNNNITTSNKETVNAQHEIKSRSVYEENYAKFIQNSSNKSIPEKSTSLPKFNQAFGKQVYQDNTQKSNDINSSDSHLTSVNINTETSECQSSDNSLNLDHIGQINSPPLLLRKPAAQTTSTQPTLMQQIKQTISPMNIQTMHGGVIYTRQIPVNIGGGQTINLITVPSTELVDETNQKQHNDGKYLNQNEMESPIIKIVPQTSNSDVTSDESINNNSSNENSQNAPTQHQPVLTQMRIKLPMLSKAPQMMSGTRLVRPSFFQIQRNVIGGANQPVYQQLVLTAAPPLGQHTIRLPQAQATKHVKVTSESQSSPESQMSSSTLEQLREFDMVLEQVKERSTVQPNSNINNSYTKLNTQSSDTAESTSITSTVTESTQQVLYSIGSNQSVNVAYVSRKPNVTTSTQSAFVRSPDSSGIIESPSSSTTHVQIPHTVPSESTSGEGSSQPVQQKAAKVSSKSKSRSRSSHPPNSLKINTVPPKPSTQKPLEDEQTTQRILYILAEYKEQVENSPDKDKPAPRRRNNPPTNPSGSSKRKKSSSSSRRPGARDISPVHGDDTCRTMGSEDSSCGTSQGDCAESCVESHSPQDSPRKVVRKLTFENETPRARPQPQRNVIVADGQTITVARGTAGKPTTAVLMPANYILPVSMVKGGQQIAIVTNRGPKLLTVAGEGGTTNALLLQRLIGPAGLKPVLTRPGVRHVRLPAAALHNLHAFNLTTATTVQPPDSTASPAPAPTPPEPIETRTNSSPWTDRESQDIKPERESSPEGSEPWNLSSSADPRDYSYEETVRTDNLGRTVLDAIPDRYSPEMEAQRIFDKMFDVDSKKSYIIDSQDDSSRCAYDIDASDSDDKAYHQVVQRKDGGAHRQHRLTHVSAAALRHKYAILEHELRLQKSLSEECEDLGVDSPSAAELFPEAELFSGSPAHDAQQHSHTPQPTILNQSCIPQPDLEDQIATDRLLRQDGTNDQHDLGVTLGLDEGIVTVSEDGMQATITLDQEEFARSHPNTTFHSEPTDEGEVQPFTITGLKGRHITSTIFHAGRAPATVLVTAPQTTVISQATPDHVIHNNVKFANINQIINSSPAVTHRNLNLASVLVKDERLTRFDGILTDSRELHLSNTASAIVHSTGNATQVIRRVCYEDDKRDSRYLMDEPEPLIAGDDAKMIAEDSSRDATLESIAGDDDNSLPERHAELFWESNSASERSDGRRPLDFSSDSEKCCKSPSFDEANSTDSSGIGTHVRLDSVIKDTRGLERSTSGDGSSADDMQPPLRTYPAKRMYHAIDGEMERSMSGKTRAGGFTEERSENLEVRRRASGRGVVKRGCHCCNGSPVPPRPKKQRQRKPTMDFTSN